MDPVREPDECFKYEGEIKRLTKANSFVADGRVIYVVKKDYTGKTSKMFIAFDEATKVQLFAHYDKDVLINFLQQQDLSCLGKDETRLF